MEPLPLVGLDMPVLLPAGSVASRLTVHSASSGTVAGDAGGRFWDAVAVGPPEASWSLMTIARRGCRPAGNGWTLDGGVRDAAGTALGSLLLGEIPNGLPGEELELRVEEARRTSDLVVARFPDLPAWTRATVDVDGHTFCLWVHERAEGLAAAADIGPVLLAAHGRTPPSWALTLAGPAEAIGILGGA